ncbi:TRAM/LAG1/CLN8-like domain-containing protein [Pseudohyphozyma bogoriensis]|nr:TRAM/LAG1/CLN8-like domain-containing protein [Pseudohyphozyma bogoriensis]
MPFLPSLLTTSSLLDTPTIRAYCSTLGVPKIVPHLPAILASTAFFFAAQEASAVVSQRLFPKTWKSLSKKTKVDWKLHFTGWLHSFISVPLSLLMIFRPSLQLVLDPIFGFSPLEGSYFAVSAGYFLYDLLISLYLVKNQGVPFVVHAAACCFIFFKAYTPLLNGLAGSFLIWELSTIFLHPHWYLDKLNLTGSLLQLINGVFLLSSFFGARVAYGLLNTYRLWKVVEDPRLDPSMKWGFRAANIALMALNLSWFRLMVLSVLRRSKGERKKKAGVAGEEKKKAMDADMGGYTEKKDE